jgi:hypothetical protein
MKVKISENSTPKANRASIKTLDFVVDSGCTQHLIKEPETLSNAKDVSINVIIADGTHMQAKSIGDLNCKLNGYSLLLKNTLYVPSLQTSLLSVSALNNQGYEIVFSNGENIKIILKDNVIFDQQCIQNIIPLEISDLPTAFVTLCDQYMLWHQRFGHPGRDRMIKALNYQNINLKRPENLSVMLALKENTQEKSSRIVKGLVQQLQN